MRLALPSIRITYDLVRPIILVGKAKRLRKDTGDSRYYAPLEKEEKISFGARVYNIVWKPFKILFEEPMLIAITVYMSVSTISLHFFIPAYSNILSVHLRLYLPPVRSIPDCLHGRTSHELWRIRPYVPPAFLGWFLWGHCREHRGYAVRVVSC